MKIILFGTTGTTTGHRTYTTAEIAAAVGVARQVAERWIKRRPYLPPPTFVTEVRTINGNIHYKSWSEADAEAIINEYREARHAGGRSTGTAGKEAAEG